MTVMSDSPLFTTSMEFLKENSWPEDEKPFIILYEPVTEVPMGNTEFSQIDGIPIYDLRPRKGKLSLDREGFIIADLPNPLTYEESFDINKLRDVYSKQLKEWLLQYLGASSAYIHECVVSLPSAIIDLSQFRRPGSTEIEIDSPARRFACTQEQRARPTGVKGSYWSALHVRVAQQVIDYIRLHPGRDHQTCISAVSFQGQRDLSEPLSNAQVCVFPI